MNKIDAKTSKNLSNFGKNREKVIKEAILEDLGGQFGEKGRPRAAIRQPRGAARYPKSAPGVTKSGPKGAKGSQK